MRARDIDHAIGAPLLWGLGRLRVRRGLLKLPGRIGLIKTRAIGDAIIASVLTKEIRRRWPDSHVIFFADESTRAIAPMLPGIDEVIEVSATRPWQSVRPLRRAGLDMLIDLGSWPRIDALLAVAAGARFCVGFQTAGQHRHYAYDLAVTHSDDVHEVENYLSLLEAVGPGLVVEDRLPSLCPSQGFEETVRRLNVLDFSRRFVVFHPWAGGSNPAAREWPAENWLELGRRVLGEGLAIVISGGPADAGASARLCERLVAGPGDTVVCLAGLARMEDMYWVLARAAAVVSVQTGTMHLAAAVGARVIGLHGPTNPKRWGPLGAKAKTIGPVGDDCGFLDLGFEYEGRPTDCMARISVGAVWTVLRGQLAMPASIED